MEKSYGSDRERSINKGAGWEKFKGYLSSHNKGLNVDRLLEKVAIKRHPVVSYGIIEFTIQNNHKGQLCAFYHVFRRRNTIEYDILIQGFSQKNQLYDLISLLSRDERDRIIAHSWEEIWDDYWIDHTIPQYSNLKAQSRRRFDEIKELLILLDDDMPCKIQERPFIFPKGKPDRKETGFETALREAREETKSSFSTGELYFNSPIVQHYVGSDDRSYTDYYYVWSQTSLYTCPRIRLSNVGSPSEARRLEESKPIPVANPDSGFVSLGRTSGAENELDPETRSTISKILPSVIPLVDRHYVIANTPVRSWTERKNKEDLPERERLRTDTISHELESDAWVEIPIFSSTREHLEWMNSVDPFSEFGIFKRHFLAIMDIHQHLSSDLDSSSSSLPTETTGRF